MVDFQQDRVQLVDQQLEYHQQKTHQQLINNTLIKIEPSSKYLKKSKQTSTREPTTEHLLKDHQLDHLLEDQQQNTH